MRVLLHICCAPCAIMPLESLRAEGHEVWGLFYNPNIQPYQENQRRLETVRQWADGEEIKLIVADEYDPETWMQMVAFREGQRCSLCLHQRLMRSAQVAHKGGFDAFGSSLLFSVRQKHRLIQELGAAAGAQRGVDFLYRDWRPLWQQGVQRSQEAGLYRQQYCGCLFSERDRYQGPPGKRQPKV